MSGRRSGPPRASTRTAELGEDHDACQRTHPEMRLECAAARLTTRIGAQLLIQRRDPRIERVDHLQRDRDLFASGGWQRQLLQPRAVHGAQQTSALGQPVVIEHGLDPLLPLTTVIHQRVAQPDPRAEIEQMVRRDPALRQPPA